MVPTISSYTRWNCLATTDAGQSRSTPILTVRCSFQRVFCLGSVRCVRTDLLYDSMSQRRQPDQTHLKLLQMSDNIHPNPGPTTKYPCPVCTRNVTSRGVSYKCTKCSGWVHANCSEILNAAQYRRKNDSTCDTCSAHGPSNRHHQLNLPLRLPNRLVMIARSTPYSSTLTKSGTS